MSWVQSSVIARRFAAAALLVCATAAAADILVVRAVGPSAKAFPPGKRVPETAKLALKAGDQLVVLDGRGTRTIRGPGNFTAGVPAVTTALAANAPRRAAVSRARIGAVRGTGDGEPRPPTIWHVDVTKSANACVADPTKVTLWRPDAQKAATLKIAGAAGNSKQVAWAEGASTLAWPADVPVAEGAEYSLSWSASPATKLRFRTIPQKPAGLEDIAQALIRAECTAQLDVFIETVKLPEDRAPAG